MQLSKGFIVIIFLTHGFQDMILFQTNNDFNDITACHSKLKIFHWGNYDKDPKSFNNSTYCLYYFFKKTIKFIIHDILEKYRQLQMCVS